MTDRARPQIVLNDGEGKLLAAADIKVVDPLVARASLHLESGHLPAGTRARLVDAVLDAPEVSSCQHVQIAFPLGDAETLDRVRERCDTGEVRAAGATCLVEAYVSNPGAGSSLSHPRNAEPH